MKISRGEVIKKLETKLDNPALNVNNLAEITREILRVLLGDKKITQLTAATNLLPDDVLSGVDIHDPTMAPTGTTKKYSFTTIYSNYLLSEFDAVVDNVGTAYKAYATLPAAVTAGAKVIKVTAAFTLPSTPIAITQDTRIYIDSGVDLGNFFKGFTIAANCKLYICSLDPATTKISIGLTSDNECFSGDGTVYTSGIYYKNIGNANTPLSSCLVHIDNCIIETSPGTANTGVNLTIPGSTIKDSYIICNGTGASGGMAYYLGAGCQGDNISLGNALGLTAIFAIIDEGAQQNNLSLAGGVLGRIVLEVNGTLTGDVAADSNTSVQMSVGDGATISASTISTTSSIGAPAAFVSFIGASAMAFSCTFNLPVNTANTATGTLLLGCYGGSTWTDGGAGTQGFMNSGSLPNNSTGGTGLSPFQAALDALGVRPNYYVNAGAAYTAGKSELYTVANIIETADITMLSAEQLFVQVGQNFTWNLAALKIMGAAGTSLTINLTDGSAVFAYATAGNPFVSFDANSIINIIGRGGIVQNTSTTTNSYIECIGILLVSDIRFLLPNVSGGGIKTNLYSVINGIKFTGGGNACDTGILANGGKISNIIFSGNNWANNAILLNTTGVPSVYDTVFVDINAAVSLVLHGNASNISRNLDPSYTNAILSIALGENDSLTNSYADVLVVPTGVTGVKVIGGYIETLSLAADNTTEIEFIGTTFGQAVTLYGKVKYSRCHFLGGGTTDAGSSVIITGSDSADETTFTFNGAKIRAGNDAIIGNDYGDSTATISEYDAEVDGSGTEASHYATFNAAVAAGTSEILMTADTSLSANVVFTKPVRLKLLGHKLTLNGFTINFKTYDFVVEGVNSDNSGIVISDTNTTEALFSDSDPDNPTANLILRDVSVDMSAVTTPNCSLGQTLSLFTNQGTKLIASNVDSSGLSYGAQAFNAFGNDLQVEVPASFTSCARAVMLNSLSALNRLDIYTIDTLPSQILVGVYDSSILNLVAYSSANISGMTIEVDSILNKTQIFSSSVSTINVNVLSDGAVIRDGDLGTGIVDCGNKNNIILDNVIGNLSNNGGNKTQISNCNFLDPVTISGNNQQIVNSNFSTLTNTGNDTSLSNCYATTWGTETGTGRLSSTCQGAIPNTLNSSMHVESGTTVALAINRRYAMQNALVPVVGTLPVSSTAGDVIKIIGAAAGGWSIAQNSGDQIFVGAASTTVGVLGSVSSTSGYDNIELTSMGGGVWVSSTQPTGTLTVI